MAEQRTYPPREFDCETIIKFGKHVNKTCKEVYEQGDPGYLEWMMDKFTNDTFTDRFVDMLRGDVVAPLLVDDWDEDDIPF